MVNHMTLNHFVTKSETNEALALDPNALLAHHLMIVGATGNGKSTSLLSLVESLQQVQQTTIIFDATGEYSQIPHAITYTLGENANLDFSEIDAHDVANILGIYSDRLIQKVAMAIESLRIQKNIIKNTGTYIKINKRLTTFDQEQQQLSVFGYDYDATLLMSQMIQEFAVPFGDSKANYELLGQEIDYTAVRSQWGELLSGQSRVGNPTLNRVFNMHHHTHDVPRATQTDIFYILRLFSEHRSQQRTLVIDVSQLKAGSSVSRLVLSLLLKKLLLIRMASASRFPITIFLDEAHRYMPENQEQLNDTGLFKILREGRKYGIYSVVSTQSPLDMPAQISGQFGSLLVHQLNNPDELQQIGVLNNEIDYHHLVVGQAALKKYQDSDTMLVNVVNPTTKHDTASPEFR